jgi:hypothetical protein
MMTRKKMMMTITMRSEVQKQLRQNDQLNVLESAVSD